MELALLRPFAQLLPPVLVTTVIQDLNTKRSELSNVKEDCLIYSLSVGTKQEEEGDRNKKEVRTRMFYKNRE